jgi:ABC-type branched-subunit amino acid transport system substrate-binding protein
MSQPGAGLFLAAYDAAGFSSAPTDYGPYAYDATNSVLATLQSYLKGKTSLRSGARARVVSGLQKIDTTGVGGAIKFDKYGDIADPTFTMYIVSGSPPAWTALP